MQASLKRHLSALLLAFSICLSWPSSASANLLSPSDETLQALVGSQEENLITLLALFGPFNGPLVFDVQINPVAMTFNDSLIAATYNGVPIQFATNGSFDSTSGLWTATTVGAIGLASLNGVGIYTFTDPPGTTGETSNYDNSDKTSHTHDTRTWVTDPTDAAVLLSFDTYLTTDLKTGKTTTTMGSDSRRLTLDELIDDYNLSGAFDPNNPNRVYPVLIGHGQVNRTSGAGVFVITESPEPASWMFAAVVLLFPVIARRR
jgi:hypothetical protein